MNERPSPRPQLIGSPPRGRITYHADIEKRVVFETWTGAINVPELRSHWEVCLTDPDVLAIKRTLVDLRECEILFSGAEWVNQLERFVLGNPVVPGWLTAIIVNKSYIHGVARQFLTYTSGVLTGEIFNSSDAALAWLENRPQLP